MRLRRIALLALPCLAFEARAATRRGLPNFGVLAFYSPDGAPSDAELELLTESFRGALVTEAGARFKVLTSDAMAMALPPEKQRECAGECSLEIGRKANVEFIADAKVRAVGGQKILSLESYSVVEGRLLGTQQFRGATFNALATELESKGRQTIRGWLALVGSSVAPQPATGPVVASADLGTLLVTSDVEGAEISIDGRPQGVSAGRKEVSFSLAPGRKQVKVSKAGYLDELRMIELSAGETARFEAHLEPEAKASAPSAMAGGTTAFLTIKSDPKSAVITLDGKKVGKTPRTVDVAPGKHRVSLSLEWYAEVATDVTVADGATQKLDLKLVPDFGEVEVSTTPAQATVFLDGRQVGTADPTLSLPRVTVGKHL